MIFRPPLWLFVAVYHSSVISSQSISTILSTYYKESILLNYWAWEKPLRGGSLLNGVWRCWIVDKLLHGGMAVWINFCIVYWGWPFFCYIILPWSDFNFLQFYKSYTLPQSSFPCLDSNTVSRLYIDSKRHLHKRCLWRHLCLFGEYSRLTLSRQQQC